MDLRIQSGDLFWNLIVHDQKIPKKIPKLSPFLFIKKNSPKKDTTSSYSLPPLSHVVIMSWGTFLGERVHESGNGRDDHSCHPSRGEQMLGTARKQPGALLGVCLFSCLSSSSPLRTHTRCLLAARESLLRSLDYVIQTLSCGFWRSIFCVDLCPFLVLRRRCKIHFRERNSEPLRWCSK